MRLLVVLWVVVGVLAAVRHARQRAAGAATVTTQGLDLHRQIESCAACDALAVAQATTETWAGAAHGDDTDVVPDLSSIQREFSHYRTQIT